MSGNTIMREKSAEKIVDTSMAAGPSFRRSEGPPALAATWLPVPRSCGVSIVKRVETVSVDLSNNTALANVTIS